MKQSLKNCSQRISKSVLDICWGHWNRLGLYATGPVNPYSTDIECAILLCGAVGEKNERLMEGVFIWLYKYGELVNRERLSHLLKKADDQKIFECLNSFFERLNHSRWKSLLTLCKKKSGNLKENLRRALPSKEMLSKKLVDERQVLKRNALLRYRYLMGTSARADVLYLFSISEALKNKKEMDFLTTAKLSKMLGFDISSLFRIQQDFEAAGVMGGHSQETWKLSQTLTLFESVPLEKGIVDWLSILRLLIEALSLAAKMEGRVHETILKADIYDFQTRLFKLLYAYDFLKPRLHQIPSPPLEKYSALELALMLAGALEKVVLSMTGE